MQQFSFYNIWFKCQYITSSVSYELENSGCHCQYQAPQSSKILCKLMKDMYLNLTWELLSLYPRGSRATIHIYMHVTHTCRKMPSNPTWLITLGAFVMFTNWPMELWWLGHRDQSVYVPSQWETTLYFNVVSHWLGAYTKWSLGPSATSNGDISIILHNIHNVNHLLTHWGGVTHICVSKLAIIVSDNGLSPGWHQAVIWSNAGILLIGPLGTNLSEILIGIVTFSFKKMHMKMSSAILAAILSRPQCVKKTTFERGWEPIVIVELIFSRVIALNECIFNTSTLMQRLHSGYPYIRQWKLDTRNE